MGKKQLNHDATIVLVISLASGKILYRYVLLSMTQDQAKGIVEAKKPPEMYGRYVKEHPPDGWTIDDIEDEIREVRELAYKNRHHRVKWQLHVESDSVPELREPA